MMDPGVWHVPQLMPETMKSRSQHPLGEVTERAVEPAGLEVVVSSDHEALIEDFSPGMDGHAERDVRLVHVRFDLGETIVGDPHRPAAEAAPFRMRYERVGGFDQHI